MPRSQVRILPGPFPWRRSAPVTHARIGHVMGVRSGSGDDGTTGVIGGGRVEKDSPRIEAIGAVDELNCLVGLALAACGDETLSRSLDDVQQRLFDLGADLASPQGRPRLSQAHVAEIEQMTNAAVALLEPAKSLVVPGGSELAARLHVARAVCRRAERLCVTLRRVEQLSSEVVVYLNRLSDLLFALARQANQLAGVVETEWPPPTEG